MTSLIRLSIGNSLCIPQNLIIEQPQFQGKTLWMGFSLTETKIASLSKNTTGWNKDPQRVN